MSWKRWVFPYCRLWSHLLRSALLQAQPIDRTKKASFPRCYRAVAHPHGSWTTAPTLLMLWFLFAGRLRLGAVLQPLEFLHFMLRGRCLSLFPVKASQAEMRLRRE